MRENTVEKWTKTEMELDGRLARYFVFVRVREAVWVLSLSMR